jgi:sugar phosphate permease
MNSASQRNSAEGPNRMQNIILILLCTCFQSVAYAGISLFLPIIRQDLNISFTQGGSISAITLFVYALMQIPAGFIADRYGLKKIFFLGVLGTTILSLLFGFVTELWQALLIQGMSGVFRAFLFAPGLALLASWFPPERRAMAMALSLVGLFSGQLIISLTGPVFVKYFNWRFPFIFFALIGILSSFIYLIFSKPSPYNKPSHRVRLEEVFDLFRHRFMWICAVIQYVRLAVMQGITFWLPSLLIDEKGLSLQVTGYLIALRSILTVPSILFGGLVSDKLKSPSLVIGSSLVFLSISSVLIVIVDSMPVLITAIVINALFIQFYFGPIFAAPVDVYGAHMTGTLTGFGNFFANMGAFSFVYLLGYLKDRTGLFESGFYAIGALCVIGILFSVMMERLRLRLTKLKLMDSGNMNGNTDRTDENQA